mmetsp:Transcript_30058/g.54613  ORF Transcript_30058/g.54613 Transcript_30058/m.54613 type:complete len:393 (-) Transcript_30058:63-1241(-)
MPRGPGKKENYNLDYSRFNKFDHLDDEDDDVICKPKEPPAEADAAGSPPQIEELLRGMPRDLQEAYQLSAISKQSGDPAAQRRASELALRAVQNGSPEVQREFLRNISEQMPEAAAKLSSELMAGPGVEPSSKDPKQLLETMEEQATAALTKKKLAESPEEIGTRVDNLREQLLAGQESTWKELENLKKQQEDLERIKSPEEFFKFMHEGGLKPEDMQRIFSGDTQHMEAKCKEMLEKSTEEHAEQRSRSEAASQAAEEIHSSLFGRSEDKPDASSTPAATPKAVPATPSRPPPPAEPEVKIPMYRLQYQKDSDGRYTTVELRCNLPGVADMSGINLDVSEKHIRLSTEPPVPRYAVNAGPFPVLIDPSAARAKYSKKREELCVSVSVKPEL